MTDITLVTISYYFVLTLWQTVHKTADRVDKIIGCK